MYLHTIYGINSSQNCYKMIRDIGRLSRISTILLPSSAPTQYIWLLLRRN